MVVAAYESDAAAETPRAVRLSLAEATVELEEIQPFDPARPFLIIIDPGSISRMDAEAFLSAVAADLTRRRPMPPVRLGIAVLGGILLDPITDPGRLRMGFDRAVQGYFPPRGKAQVSGPGRFFDLVVALIDTAQEQHGDLDCLILAEDSSLPDEQSDYLSRGLERKLLTTISAAGTTVYGCLRGSGIWHGLCPAAGGQVFALDAPAASVMDHIFVRRRRGLLMRGRLPLDDLGRGRIPVFLSAHDSGGPSSLEGPDFLWIGPGLTKPPDYYGMRQGLDWKRRSDESERDGNYTVALRCMENAIQEDPWNFRSYYEAGRLAAAQGDLARASEFLAEAIAFVEADEPTLSLYANVQEKRGLAVTALAAMNSRKAPATHPSRKIRARLFAGLRRYQEAGSLYASLVEEEPQDHQLRGEYGRVLWALGDEAGARAQFEASQLLNPAAFGALLGLSEIALAHQNLEAADNWIARALAERPGDPEGLVQLAKLRQAYGDQAGAGSWLRRAHDLAPHRHDILALLADVEVAAGRIEEAKRLLIGALAGNPGSEQLYRALAGMLFGAGDSSAAAGVLEAGAAQIGDRAYTLYQLAAQWREKQAAYGQALLDYRAMLDTAPSGIAGDLKESLQDHLTYLALLMGGSPEDIIRGAAAVPLHPGAERRPSLPRSAPAVNSHDGLIVPGGIELLANTVGLESATLRAPGALGRLFAFILESYPSYGGKLRDHPVRQAAISYLRDHRALSRYLKRERLWPHGEGCGVGQSLMLTLAGSKAQQKAAKRFLKFFGVKYSLRQRKDGEPEILLVLKGGRSNEARQRMLRNLGVNLHGSAAREIRIPMADGRLPLMFDAAVWKDKILAMPGIPEEELLENMLLRPDAMRLYLALEECPELTRAALLEASLPGELVQIVQAIRLFARFLDVREDQVVFPGSPESWRAFLDASPGDGIAALVGKLLRKNNGRALGLYYFLSAAPEGARRYLTSSIQNLSLLYSLLPPLNGQSEGCTDEKIYRELGRLAAMLFADDNGLILSLDPRLAGRLPGLPATASAASGETQSVMHLSMEDLSELMQRLGKPSLETASILNALEFLSYVHSEFPEFLDDATIAAIAADPGAIPVFMNLIWSLRPPAALAARYIEYCRNVARAGVRGWNESRTRTSQALFYLLSCLHRRGTIDREEGRALLGELLTKLEVDEEAAFARGVASLLSGRLLPALRKRMAGDWDPSELFWRALAGPTRRFSIMHQGAPVEGNLSAYRLGRMRAAVQQQDFIPLSDLLRLQELLEAITSDGLPAVDDLSLFVDRLKRVPKRQVIPDLEINARRKPAAADLEALLRSWSSFMVHPGPQQALPAGLIRDTAAALHLELGVTLLSYCYAFEGSPETDPLVFDPYFVRRHSFYCRPAAIIKGWNAARLVSSVGSELLVEGALSGLGSQLDRLQATRMDRSFASGIDVDLFPVLTASLKSMQHDHRSGRGQEFVALTARLGREIVTLSAVKGPLLLWCEKELDEMLLPGRLQQTLRCLRARDPIGALSGLSPSELFLLGNRYISAVAGWSGGVDSLGARVSRAYQGAVADAWPARASSNGAMAISGPVLDRLLEILPEAGTADARLFQEEVAQYGVFLQERMGLAQSSFAVREPYEQIAGWNSDILLFERICDLKVQLAELGYSLGWPAAFGEVVAEVALREIRPRPGEARSGSWKHELGRITALSPANARQWVEQCLNLGYLVPPSLDKIGASLQVREKP